MVFPTSARPIPDRDWKEYLEKALEAIDEFFRQHWDF
ncbi:RteC domain-containing protein [Photobacterium atrarenae]|uniref:RteC domain-containing protein n=1 Tax=Photobacterium atrarenae TaxID=865757 RepID=A0ABY5GHU0_9GAMM|nr:RteC domain-containing protein [Photobacterium atrarenae]UTV28746.1 RteC domain-containing protein [Photobacterium atrarenae]